MSRLRSVAGRHETENLMLDQRLIDQLRMLVADRYTPEELIELLGVSTEEVFDMFIDQVLELPREVFYD